MTKYWKLAKANPKIACAVAIAIIVIIALIT